MSTIASPEKHLILYLEDKIMMGNNNVDVIEATPRLGFGKACNEGSHHAINNGAKIIICINQDVILGPAVITELIQPLREDDNVVMSVPILYTYDFKHIESYFLKWYLSQCP